MAKHGKKYTAARERVEREREYAPTEAIELVKSLKPSSFDESVELHIRTGLNVRHADEQLRGTIALPNGLGKTVKIAVFAKGDKAREAEEAGADIVGAEDLAKQIEEGFDDFDVAKAVEESKAGKIEYRTDRTAIVHLNIGKTSFDERALLENYAAVIEEIIRAKPSAAKGRYLRTVTIASTMGPGVKVDPTRTRDILGEGTTDAAAA